MNKLERLHRKITDSNYEPVLFFKILSDTGKLSEWKVLMISFMVTLVLFIAVVYFFIIPDKIQFIRIVIFSVLTILFVTKLLVIYKNYLSKQSKDELIQFWFQSADHEKINKLIELLVQNWMSNEISHIARYYLNATSPEHMQTFPIFWKGVSNLGLVEKYYKIFLPKYNLIPINYRLSYQTSTAKYSTLYIADKKALIHYPSPIVQYCLLAEYYLNYYSPPDLSTDDRLFRFCDELKSIVDLIDSEKQTFLQLWNDRHLDIDLRRILSEIYLILTAQHEDPEQNSTIYHLLIKNTTNVFLKYIAISRAIEYPENFPLDLDQIPVAFEIVSKLCQGSTKNQVDRMPPWEKLSIYWLHLLGKRQKFEFPHLSRLFCKTCRVFGKEPIVKGYQGKIFHLDPKPECSICPECKETTNLIYIPGMVIGVISYDIFCSKVGDDLHIGIWKENEKKVFPSVYEKLILYEELKIDYDWALVAILEQLPKKEGQDYPIEVEIHPGITLKENTLRILGDFCHEKRIFFSS